MAILVAAFFFLVIAGFVLYFITVYNSLVSIRNEVDKAWSNIDVLLKQRFDELPKLVDTCKGYMKYEQETLQKIVQARTHWLSAKTVGEKLDAQQESAGAVKTLFAVAEKYPDLKANQNFLQLQTRISQIESHIADRRELYNDATNTFNIRIAQLPDVFLARMLAYTPRPLFTATAAEKADVSVSMT
ncbi:MAG: LemA family protein [Acidobacteria bacterium]|nr:LemA family protein [Acidobacteriota bacterium]